ncbi:hypothetical protein EN836_23465 [Mesorhizobium sp. M1C.F.Ca.ET.193.01.1.1]|uniref:hypothetical protein n=1 Tax=unclassified Mesorhizobium TaxID=325217 RepID=UPI000FD1DBF4|nr:MULTISPECIES: hypothetical protein [unclassified Mesorhizobium]TGS91386.1 hypothetical protein EN820_52850 [bacterium M00.F.Ca.ET.177.01.1.1]TGQ51535.1 hypothetical protein EN853_23455 [Mesorhizobium sp. M1C.F.Ca.ET.210.01.1.1]TGQ67763.1 hypothetical protein EN855_023465 [Mesorhizobium sp. M1C.F.Ca.ET.212.01.1.1]TGR02356.1 hypothetical protein EN847_23455 [Mesorhizobium sp. M1C.F.Ca.ET.204.01.1.1]TGR22898.1 hypothetical protein EN839_23455 [Mesorhizobium sp. M1C.F.Ca.ET.196.01.1.1]
MRVQSITLAIFLVVSDKNHVPLRTIQFTQEQARVLADVSPGDVRAWRKAVPYLAAKSGKAARFTFADLVGLAITANLTGAFHVRISDMGTGVDALFRALAQARPPHLENLIALIDTASARLVPTADLGACHFTGPIFVVPCDPILARIGQRVMPAAPGTRQTALPFPPQMLKAGR